MNRYPLLIMIVLLGLCWGVNRLYPLDFGFGIFGKTAGWIILLCGISLLVAAFGLFQIEGTTVNPTKEPDKLVTDGIYRVTRNPMYLGMLLILSGVPFVMESMAGLMFPLIFFLIMDQSIIPKEERTVEGVFGKEYLRYKLKTRRWI